MENNSGDCFIELIMEQYLFFNVASFAIYNRKIKGKNHTLIVKNIILLEK